MAPRRFSCSTIRLPAYYGLVALKKACGLIRRHQRMGASICQIKGTRSGQWLFDERTVVLRSRPAPQVRQLHDHFHGRASYHVPKLSLSHLVWQPVAAVTRPPGKIFSQCVCVKVSYTSRRDRIRDDVLLLKPASHRLAERCKMKL